MHFTATCLGSDPLGLREMLEAFANELWLAAHDTREKTAEIVMDHFMRTVAQVPF
jgi:hypothetical protein